MIFASRKLRVGIVGCGTIGSALAHALARQHAPAAQVVALTDRLRSNALALQRALPSHPAVVSLPELIRRSQLVIEAASVAVAARVARLALAANRHVLIMSAGGLLADGPSWQRLARRSRGRLYVPSGGLCGLDGIKAMAVGRIRRLQLTSRKPPHALAQAPYVKAKRLDLSRLHRPTLLLEGSAAEAIRAFPQNANVAATLTLASWVNEGPQTFRFAKFIVRVVADPAIRANVHELEVIGDCGRVSARMESRPAAGNPKTSEVAIRSALATVRQLFSAVHIGT